MFPASPRTELRAFLLWRPRVVARELLPGAILAQERARDPHSTRGCKMARKVLSEAWRNDDQIH
jgi:hypothetical protein